MPLGPAMDAMAAGAIIGIIMMMVVPVPPRLLDFLLAFNLTFSLVVLLVSVYSAHPLEFSAFPALLLVTTLLRLALNVSSTRLILLHGYAGEIIARFGDFVVGGEPVVGFLVFLILVIIQFVVITRGAERIAEVAARFTLDAMPGKQMSIDADLSAGLITEEEAGRRRKQIEKEADFYGAMDGASKFVKGDAVAGLIITVLNLLGGMAMGVSRDGLPVGEAARKYALLTVGDGLVAQVPALLISTAAGMIVSRAASEHDLGRDVAGQISGQPKVLSLAAAALIFFGLIPGFPKLPFFALAGAMGALAKVCAPVSVAGERWGARDGGRGPMPEPKGGAAGTARPGDRLEDWSNPEVLRTLMEVDPICIELGYSLLFLANPSQGGDLLARTSGLRRQLAQELGFVLPPVRIRDDLVGLEPTEYVIKLKGIKVAGGKLLPGHCLAMNASHPPAPPEGVPAVPAREPVFGVEAWWIPEEYRDSPELGAFTVVEPSTVLTTHLAEVVKAHAHELLGRQETRNLLDALRLSHPALVDDLVPGVVSVGLVQKVLQGLLREGIPIRDLVGILEAVADASRTTQEAWRIVEMVRQSMKRQIALAYGFTDGRASAIVLDPATEHEMLSACAGSNEPVAVPLQPDDLRKFVGALTGLVQKATSSGKTPVIVCAPPLRPHLRKLLDLLDLRIQVASYAEMAPDVRLEPIGVLKIDGSEGQKA